MIKSLKEKYAKLPKLLRFTLEYGTAPIWFPPFVILVLITLIVVYPFVWLGETYRNFK